MEPPPCARVCQVPHPRAITVTLPCPVLRSPYQHLENQLSLVGKDEIPGLGTGADGLADHADTLDEAQLQGQVLSAKTEVEKPEAPQPTLLATQATRGFPVRRGPCSLQFTSSCFDREAHRQAEPSAGLTPHVCAQHIPYPVSFMGHTCLPNCKRFKVGGLPTLPVKSASHQCPRRSPPQNMG